MVNSQHMGRITVGQVVLFVLLALVALIFNWAEQLPTDGTLLGDWLLLGQFLLLHLLLSLPFDFVSQKRLRANFFVSVILFTLTFWVIGGMLLLAGRAGCLSAVLTVIVGVMTVQIQFQAEIARFIGRIPLVTPNIDAEAKRLKRHGLEIGNVVVLDSAEASFTGGFSGRLGHAQLVIPNHWLAESGTQYAALQMLRRAGALKNHSRDKGVLIAFVLNLLMFIVASTLPNAGTANVAQLINIILYMTLFSAVVHLFLPIITRDGVLECDYFAAKKGIPKRILTKLWRETAWQTQNITDPKQPTQFDRFHPIPSLDARLDNITIRTRPAGFWNAQQMTLYLSWSCCGLLSRAVWNVGRPHLWVFASCD